MISSEKQPKMEKFGLLDGFFVIDLLCVRLTQGYKLVSYPYTFVKKIHEKCQKKAFFAKSSLFFVRIDQDFNRNLETQVKTILEHPWQEKHPNNG